MNVQDEIESITSLYPVLGELHPRLQRDLLDGSIPVQAPAGEILFDVDSVIQSFLLLTHGSIRVILPGSERELLLYRVLPGTCCAISISHLMGNTQYRARAEVENAIRGIAVPQPLFRKMMGQSPHFNDFVLRAFSDRFTQLIGLISRVISMRLEERLARILISEGMVIHTTHSQLANDLGSVREVISRILKEFEARGLIKLERGQIQILEPERLLKMSQISDPSHRQS